MQYEGDDKVYTAVNGYGNFHGIHWHAYLTAPCGCLEKSLEQAPLGLGVATVTGGNWTDYEERHNRGEEVDYKTCIYLAQEGWARWHALCMEFESSKRATVLKTKDCCESCALTATSALNGQWLLLI